MSLQGDSRMKGNSVIVKRANEIVQLEARAWQAEYNQQITDDAHKEIWREYKILLGRLRRIRKRNKILEHDFKNQAVELRRKNDLMACMLKSITKLKEEIKSKKMGKRKKWNKFKKWMKRRALNEKSFVH